MLKESENPVSCDYYNNHDINKIQIHQHDLSIIHLNTSSLASHIHELKLFLGYLKLALILSVYLKAGYPNTIFQPSTSIYRL